MNEKHHEWPSTRLPADDTPLVTRSDRRWVHEMWRTAIRAGLKPQMSWDKFVDKAASLLIYHRAAILAADKPTPAKRREYFKTLSKALETLADLLAAPDGGVLPEAPEYVRRELVASADRELKNRARVGGAPPPIPPKEHTFVLDGEEVTVVDWGGSAAVGNRTKSSHSPLVDASELGAPTLMTRTRGPITLDDLVSNADYLRDVARWSKAASKRLASKGTNGPGLQKKRSNIQLNDFLEDVLQLWEDAFSGKRSTSAGTGGDKVTPMIAFIQSAGEVAGVCRAQLRPSSLRPRLRRLKN